MVRADDLVHLLVPDQPATQAVPNRCPEISNRPMGQWLFQLLAFTDVVTIDINAMARLALVFLFVHATVVSATADECGNRTILLVDDHFVLYRPGTERILHRPIRHSQNPLVVCDKPWEAGTIAYCSVHRESESEKHQLWYQAWHPTEGAHLCYAVSDDGLRWVKPTLGLIEFNGSKNNNIVMRIGFGAGVLVDPSDANRERRYKYAYWDDFGTCIAFSPDGIHWTKYDRNPVILGSHGEYKQPPLVGDPNISKRHLGGPPLSTSDVTDPIWDPLKSCYAIYAKTWLDGPDGTMHWKRAVVRTESDDFIHWTKPVLVVAPDEFDDRAGDSSLKRDAGGGGTGRKQLHSGPTFVYNGIYFSTLQVLDASVTGTMPIELALSRDGYQWQRPFRDLFWIPALEDKSQFDASIIWSNATPLFLENEFHFYYGAYGHTWNSADRYQSSGIGLATMPRDRFAGVRPTEKIGQITLKAVDLSSYDRLEVNADASAGAVRIEVLNTSGYRMPGYTRQEAVPLEGDDLHHVAAWKRSTISQLPAGDYRLRLHLENAEVFAITLVRTRELGNSNSEIDP